MVGIATATRFVIGQAVNKVPSSLGQAVRVVSRRTLQDVLC